MSAAPERTPGRTGDEDKFQQSINIIISRKKRMRMTKDMYESLQVKDLKAIADSRGLSLPVRIKKDEIVAKLLELDRAEDERVLQERAAAREQAQADGTRPEAPARRGRKPSVKKDRDLAPNEHRRPGRPRKTAVPAAENAEEPANAAAAAQETVHAESSETAADSTAAEEREPARVREPRRASYRERRAQGTRTQESTAPAAAASAAGAPAAAPQAAAADSSAQDAAVSQAAPQASAAPAPVQPQAGAPSQAVAGRYARRGLIRPDQQIVHKNELNHELDSGEIAHGILEVMADGYGFIRSSNYMPGDNDVYVAPSQIRRFNLKTGDILEGNIRIRSQNEKFSALLFVKSVNGIDPEESKRRFNFEDMTPIFPDERIRLEKQGASIAMRVMDLMCPVGKGQRGMIVSPPKAGKTTLVKEVAKSVKANNPNIHLIILLIDERPEEVTDIREALEGPNVEVIYSTFDELPEHHKRVAEMTIERAKRLVEGRHDVMILLDSITRLTRAYNLTEPSSGRTLSGGLDPVALHMPKRFFGAARNMREGGSLTILATALIETGSKMDDVVYEEFKGTGNMEMILNRKLSERRIFPAVDLAKSGTRRDDLLLTPDEQECVATIRKAFIGARGEEATDSVLDLFYKTRTNGEFVNMVKKHMWSF